MIVRLPIHGRGGIQNLESICRRCCQTLPKPALRVTRRGFTHVAAPRQAIAAGLPRERLRKGYFSANGILEALQAGGKRGALTSTVSTAASRSGTEGAVSDSPHNIGSAQELPHRRRQRLREEQNARLNGSHPPEPEIPHDASAQLAKLSSSLPVNSLRRLLSTLLSLTKPRLSFLVVLTAAAAYSIYPVPDVLQPSLTHTPSLSTLTLLFLTTGTMLSSASANTLNMLYEPKWDAMMSRTKNRPLVRGLISPAGALLFAVVSGVSGVTALYYGVNPTTAFLGALNIVLYAGVYTPLKRVSVINTWVGAIVGGIPPLMGWTAAAGQTATGDGAWQELLLGEQSVGGWLLAAFLVAWQFPHFMSLSWSIRDEYKNAGYKMLAWTNPARNGRVALRYSVLFLPICFGLCYAGVTDWSFAVTSTPVNAWIIYEAYRFWKYEGLKGSAKGLFWASVWHLPIVMVMAMLEKKGLGGRVWRAIVGEPDLDDDEEWEEDEGEVGKSLPPTESSLTR